VVKDKNPELSEEQKLAVAQAVGIGAIKYPMLARENTKVVTFDWETALDFNGQAAPYIQYAYVRANSILKKANGPAQGTQHAVYPEYELSTAEIQLIEQVSRIPKEIQKAAAEYRPLYISTLAYELARAFNDFYNQCPVLSAEPAVRDFRLQMVAAARQAIGNVLTVLGIQPPDVM
jgi:arginyl-tRNA synthetase